MVKLLPLFLLLLVATVVLGQKTKNPVKPRIKTNPAPLPTATPTQAPAFVFTKDVVELPALYSGDKVEELFKAYNQTIRTNQMPVKDEFETTADYQKRLDAFDAGAQQKNSTGNKNSKPFVFVINNQLSEYDADTQNLRIYTTFTQLSETVKIVLDSKSTNSSYEATNAYNARVTVTRNSYAEYSVEIAGKFSEPFYETTLEMDIPTAKALKPYIRTLFVFTLVEPYLKVETDSSEATFSRPYETRSSKNRFYAKPVALWFFDASSGKILSKKNFE